MSISMPPDNSSGQTSLGTAEDRVDQESAHGGTMGQVQSSGVFVTKLPREHSTPIVDGLPRTTFVLQGQSCVLETGDVWPAKAKVFTVWPYVEILSKSWEETGYTEPGNFRGPDERRRRKVPEGAAVLRHRAESCF